MKHNLLMSVLILCVLSSCNNTREREAAKPATPKALQDKTISMDMISKRGGTAILDALYNELAETNPELKKLEAEIDDVETSRKDSTDTFDNFNEKNSGYFNNAKSFAGAIRDSVLRAKMKVLIAASTAKYDASILQHKEILKMIESKNIGLNDLHLALKITRTLPMIEKYQKDQLPAVSSLKGYQSEIEKAIKHADNLLAQ